MKTIDCLLGHDKRRPARFGWRKGMSRPTEASSWLSAALCSAFAFLNTAGCSQEAAEIDSHMPGGPSSAGGAIVSYLRERRDGHSGETLWRTTVEGYPRVTGSPPLSPTHWDWVASQSKDLWTWSRYRITASRTDGVEIRKLWDFCVISTVEGPRIVAAWDADDSNVAACSQADDWPQYAYPK
jgi:hypothetical protein